MATNTIRSVKIQDMKAVILECKKCGATVGYPPRKWNSIPRMCVNCGEARMADNGMEYGVSDKFRSALQELCKATEALPYQVKFEFNGATD